jgi:Rrf2 family protein
MYVSARLDYGLRALAVLAGQADREPLTASRLAERQGVSMAYVGAILNELRREGLVVNERGRHGGYRLARPATQISVGDVVAALRIWPVDVHAYNSRADEVGDRLAALWQRLGGVTEDVLASVTVADVALGPEAVARADRLGAVGRPAFPGAWTA